MEYKKMCDCNVNTKISKVSLVLSILSACLCGCFIYKVYDLQGQILELQKGALKQHSEEIDGLQEDLRQIQRQSDGFQWNTGASNFDYSYEDYDNDSDYDDADSNKHIREKVAATNLTKDNAEKTRLKREVLMRTLDGVPVNSESYEETKRKNKTGTNTSSPSPGMYERRSRVMRVEDKSKAFRKVVKRPLLKSSDLVLEEVRPRRRHRQRRVESDERFLRVKPAIHLSGNVYDSNGLSHHERDHYKSWLTESWVKALGMDQYFFLDNGYLRITEPGLYLVYAQILYFDEHDTNGFFVYKNDETILQCTTTSHSSKRVNKSNTCYTAGINHLNDGDRLRVHDIESYRYSIFRPGKSFFGAIKLSDARRNH